MSDNPPVGRQARRAAKRPRVSVVGVIGELFITAGVLVFLFLGWQLWLNDIIVGAQQDKAGAQLAQHLSEVPIKAAPPAAVKDYGTPAVSAVPGNAAQFAVVYIPRFGTEYAKTLAQGVGTHDVLDQGWIGHYPGTAMPGEIGNFAVAAHRTTHGAPFKQIASLQVGDKIYVQTAIGYYTYAFRGLEYVRPTAVDVLDPVPRAPGAAPTDRIMTMTSCNPMFSASERIIAYASLESWQPVSAGAPKAVADTIAAGKG